MNCLTCATLSQDTSVVASCAHCGAGVCLSHAVTVTVPRRPVGLIPQDEGAGARRVLCTECATPLGLRAVATSAREPEAAAVA